MLCILFGCRCHTHVSHPFVLVRLATGAAVHHCRIRGSGLLLFNAEVDGSAAVNYWWFHCDLCGCSDLFVDVSARYQVIASRLIDWLIAVETAVLH